VLRRRFRCAAAVATDAAPPSALSLCGYPFYPQIHIRMLFF
jgi:hypothetical protein